MPMWAAMFSELGRTIRYAIGDDRRTARLRSLLVTTAVAGGGCYALLVR
ncbi:hypothetical protein HUT18_26655 [Streptomyces sp. NA04227]|nr:hypothetical protein [Streptomyces sp. NA04227]QKW09436.1 hypothetical protein HUT18_26655 [Streptomyces sp. NA04227]